MTFRVGQLVCCIRDPFARDRPEKENGPRVGQVLTIREIVQFSELCLRFDEIVNAPRHYAEGFLEAAFPARYFRPIVTPSIEVFQAMLTPSKQSERV